jgi:hypothetical protein
MKLYRIELVNFAGPGENIEFHEICRDFNVVRETLCFYIIRIGMKEKKIGKTSKGKFANTSKELALKDAYARNRLHYRFLKHSLYLAKLKDKRFMELLK